MKYPALAAAVLGILTTSALAASTTWTDTTGNPLWGFAANWNNGVPNTTTPAVLQNDLTTVFSIDIQGANVPTLGITFNSGAGSSSFLLRSSAVAPTGFQMGPNGIVNNDSHAQVFNVPITLIAANGSSGAGASQTWTAGSGNLVISNTYSSGSSVNNNGGTLTIGGSFDTIFSSNSRGDITGAGGLIKSGTGNLTLGGTNANTFSGGVTINAGTIIAGKASALGNSANKLTLNGGTLQANYLNLSVGVLSLQGNATIDFAGPGTAGVNNLSFADSHSQAWAAGTTLTVANWVAGDYLNFGSNSGLTAGQLSQISFAGLPSTPFAGFDPSNPGHVIPVPEPSAVAISIIGGFSLALGLVIRRRRD
jgi:autotransporter-associated beta strand protein